MNKLALNKKIFGHATPLEILMGISFSVMWSSAYTSAKIIVGYAPPLTILSLRFFSRNYGRARSKINGAIMEFKF